MVDWVCCANNCNLKKKGNMFTVGTRDISVDSRSMLDRYIGRQSVNSRPIVGRQSVDSRPIVGRYSDQLWAECKDQFLFLGNRPREKIRPRVVYVLSVNCPQLIST